MNEVTIHEGTLNKISKQDTVNHNTPKGDENGLISHTFYHSHKTHVEKYVASLRLQKLKENVSLLNNGSKINLGSGSHSKQSWDGDFASPIDNQNLQM